MGERVKVFVDYGLVWVDLAEFRRYGDGTTGWTVRVNGDRLGTLRGKSGRWAAYALDAAMVGEPRRVRRTALVPLVRAWLNDDGGSDG